MIERDIGDRLHSSLAQHLQGLPHRIALQLRMDRKAGLGGEQRIVSRGGKPHGVAAEIERDGYSLFRRVIERRIERRVVGFGNQRAVVANPFREWTSRSMRFLFSDTDRRRIQRVKPRCGSGQRGDGQHLASSHCRHQMFSDYPTIGPSSSRVCNILTRTAAQRQGTSIPESQAAGVLRRSPSKESSRNLQHRLRVGTISAKRRNDPQKAKAAKRPQSIEERDFEWYAQRDKWCARRDSNSRPTDS